MEKPWLGRFHADRRAVSRNPIRGRDLYALAASWVDPVRAPARSSVAVASRRDQDPLADVDPESVWIPDGTSTPLTHPVAPSSLFERPGHAELWIWEESEPALSRIDLATGAVVELVRNVDSVDYRAATDDIVIGTFDHTVRRFSMATGQAPTRRSRRRRSATRS